ncbi:ABC transporter permease [Streptomyces sedi]|uniref:ABC transporter permease n=1 Tax=Streptomyces sedi TaxID=555059 RepID=A0A5C4V239_9ACTN|nr:ABC transporter permease [Streptomyces sedi]TNM29827.1 ABC transporter permease [Streptomyces sedi]
MSLVERAPRAPHRAGSALRAVARAPGLLLSVVVLVLVAVAALAPSLLTGQDPLTGVPADKLLPPSAEHPFGTDQLGRDLLTRTVHGTGPTLRAALLAVAVGLIPGSLLGLLAGALGGAVDDLLMRFADVLLAIPGLLLSLALITALGFGTTRVAVAVGVVGVAGFARVMRAQVLRVRESAYVEAAHASGTRWSGVLLRHVLPGAWGPVAVFAAVEFGTVVLAISSLSFLGYGATPPQPEWGSLVAGGRDYLATSWWLTTLPGLTIALTVLAANRVARALDHETREAP